MKILLLLVSVALLNFTTESFTTIPYNNGTLQLVQENDINVQGLNFKVYHIDGRASEKCILGTDIFTCNKYPVWLHKELKDSMCNNNQVRIISNGVKFYLSIDSFGNPYPVYYENR
jgi:hypothetical protein